MRLLLPPILSAIDCSTKPRAARSYVQVTLLALVWAAPSFAEKLVDPSTVAPEYREAAEKRRAEQIRQRDCAKKAEMQKMTARERTAFLLKCLKDAEAKVGQPVSTPGGQLAPVTINRDWETFNYAAGDAGTTPSPIPFFAQIEPWNTGSLRRGTDYTTSVVLYPNTFPAGTVFNWSYPEVTASGHVYSYDSVVFGAYTKEPKNTIPPCQIQNLTTLTATHSASYTAEADSNNVPGAYFDLVYDFATFPTSTPTTEVHEISIVLHSQNYDASFIGSMPAANKFNFTDTYGTQWICYTTNPGGTGNQIVFERTDFSDGSLNATVDIKAMLQAVVSHGWASGTEWFVGTGLGAEVAQGSGSWTLHSWSFNYNGTTYP
jgi:hypothetical protein